MRINFIRDIDIVGNLYIVTIHQVHFLFDKHVIKKIVAFGMLPFGRNVMVPHFFELPV